MANSKGSAELNKNSRVEKTFREVAEEWLEESKDRIASTTHARYMEALERDVFPEYADFPISSVTELEMNSFLKRAPELAKKLAGALDADRKIEPKRDAAGKDTG